MCVGGSLHCGQSAMGTLHELVTTAARKRRGSREASGCALRCFPVNSSIDCGVCLLPCLHMQSPQRLFFVLLGGGGHQAEIQTLSSAGFDACNLAQQAKAVETCCALRYRETCEFQETGATAPIEFTPKYAALANTLTPKNPHAKCQYLRVRPIPHVKREL